jgi:hypothetical protein
MPNRLWAKLDEGAHRGGNQKWSALFGNGVRSPQSPARGNEGESEKWLRKSHTIWGYHQQSTRKAENIPSRDDPTQVLSIQNHFGSFFPPTALGKFDGIREFSDGQAGPS